jgi:hypothetical protein
MPLTLDAYLEQHARDAEPGELTNEIRLNAVRLIEAVRKLLGLFAQDRAQLSGWRPKKTNAATPGAAPNSTHLTGEGIDLADADGSLDRWCLNNQAALKSCGLWLENPAVTPRWCHLDRRIRQLPSRVFGVTINNHHP